MKIRLLIASPDLDYTEYLSKVLLGKYTDVFEVSVCSNENRLREMVAGHRADIVLAERTLTSANVIKLAAKEEAAEDHRISEGNPEGTYPKKEAAKADGGSSVRKGI